MADFDKKFIKVSARIFDSCHGIENRFVVLTEDVKAAREFFFDSPNIQVIEGISVGADVLARNLAWCDCLVMHFLNSWKAEVVLKASPLLPVVWSGWGADYYSFLPEGGRRLLGSKTRRLMDVLGRRRSHFSSRLIEPLKDVARRMIATWNVREIIRRVDVFSCPFPGDRELLRAHFGDDFPDEYAQLNYGSVTLTCAPGPDAVTGDDILVGNSATPSNNHLEVFELLSRMDLDDRRIVVPLSYGDRIYRDAIIDHGRRVFGQRLHPLVDMLPLERYNTQIAMCSLVVMGHRRQQGAGNTVTMLYKGAKVYLDDASTVFQYLRSQGAFVGSLRELQTLGASVFTPLTIEQKRKNREVLDGYAGDEVVLQRIGELVELVRRIAERKGVGAR